MLLDIFGMNDVAIQNLLLHEQQFAKYLSIDRALDTLVPKIRGEQFSYKEYIEKYKKTPQLFRPKSGFRFREKIYDHFE